ncbi:MULTISPECIES: SWIM zinc finger family protein [Calothrix]|uniref:SWIM zinc finger domain-containing protein n=2 Tax=Calothrix TaxID=1186 RepID=A0ABR8AGZ9_9CYAN|nr:MULTISPECIES: SWIM zinc finger domain-containing protein [Calothrix]MBD2199322.1 SWIM zinc finger domain-containing protein [Calothrix parietina FACHB-288]MBD2229421.1 SWIM zinc finger domain-containing protein [Calothrix anomala FACHB-343]
MLIPKLSEFTIRRNASAKSFQRGEAYYEADAVLYLTQRGNVIQAEVDGNEPHPYEVGLSFNSGGLTSVKCSCPYDGEGWCKHIVATMLVCMRQPQMIEERPTLEQLLNRLDHQQTQRLIQQLIVEYPRLIEAVDRHVTWITYTPVKHDNVKPLRQYNLDSKPFAQRVRQILRDAVRAWEDGYDEDPITEEILNLVQGAVDLCEQGDGRNAIAILAAITSSCVDNWDDVADYGADNYEILPQLNAAWCEAILTAELTPVEKVDLQVNLETWQDEWDADFGLASEALRQGWHYPLLLQVLEGDIPDMGVWEDDIPDYADDLALIRLKILERQERYQEYLYLAAAEGQTEQYLTMLGRLGRVDEAIIAAQAQMNTMEEAFALGKTLKEQNSLLEALEIAQIGLDLPGNCQYDLAIWTTDLALELNNQPVALSAMIAAFQIQPSLVSYEKIAELAGEEWAVVKPDLLQILRTSGGWGTEAAKVDIFLQEGLIEDAIAIVNEMSSYHADLIYRVMDVAIAQKPDWVIANARHRAELIMEAGKAEYYNTAVQWLKKVRTAYLEAGRKADWDSYKAKLIQEHGRKRKLMGLIKEQGLD